MRTNQILEQWRQVCPGSRATVSAADCGAWESVTKDEIVQADTEARACHTNPEVTWSKAPQVTIQEDRGPAVPISACSSMWLTGAGIAEGNPSRFSQRSTFFGMHFSPYMAGRSRHAICKLGSFRMDWRPATGSSARGRTSSASRSARKLGVALLHHGDVVFCHCLAGRRRASMVSGMRSVLKLGPPPVKEIWACRKC